MSAKRTDQIFVLQREKHTFKDGASNRAMDAGSHEEIFDNYGNGVGLCPRNFVTWRRQQL